MREIVSAACLCLVLVIAGCGKNSERQAPAVSSAAGANAATTGLTVIRIGNGAEPDTLDPQKAQGNWEADIIGNMFLGLATDGQDGTPVPGAAESWTTSPDGLTWTFKLRSGLVWSDGVAVTADDFVFSLQRILDPKTIAQYASVLYPLKNARPINAGRMPPSALGVRAIDPLTLEITLEHPVPYLIELARHQTMFAVPKHIIEKYGNDWIKPEHIVVDGPYKLAEWIPNTDIKLVKNPKFYDAANVKIDVAYFYPIADRAAELNRYKAGELDITSGIPLRQYKTLLGQFGPDMRVHSYMRSSYSIFNLSRKPFDDPRVRCALSMATDRQAIAGQLLQGLAEPAYAIVPPEVANYPNGPQSEFKNRSMTENRAEAMKLLEAAGFGPDHPLKFTYRYFDSETDRDIAIAFQNMWKAIGVRVDLLSSESKVEYDALRNGDFDVAAAGWIADYDDAQNFLYLFQSDAGPMNYGRHNDRGYDALMKQADAEPNLEARAKLLSTAEASIL
ncbi:MAG TPA: peptide ABC transporter substrate-binding protein, partial [Alphaproteobacteria bacterium]|nr:peptide ABC transporter substrate-binding protein [Alphaproteobacteria bacterium]